MLSRLISGVCKLFRSNSMPCRTHVDLDLQRWDCREVSHAHQVVGCAGEAEDPVHFAHSAMPHFAQQGDRLQPAEKIGRASCRERVERSEVAVAWRKTD